MIVLKKLSLVKTFFLFFANRFFVIYYRSEICSDHELQSCSLEYTLVMYYNASKGQLTKLIGRVIGIFSTDNLHNALSIIN